MIWFRVLSTLRHRFPSNFLCFAARNLRLSYAEDSFDINDSFVVYLQRLLFILFAICKAFSSDICSNSSIVCYNKLSIMLGQELKKQFSTTKILAWRTQFKFLGLIKSERKVRWTSETLKLWFSKKSSQSSKQFFSLLLFSGVKTFTALWGNLFLCFLE